MSSVEQPLVELVGVVEELAIGDASKQARRGPVLVTSEGPVSVYVLGDNPFSPSQLARWSGQRVSMRGVWRGTTLRVAPEDIAALPMEPEKVDSDAAGWTLPSSAPDGEEK